MNAEVAMPQRASEIAVSSRGAATLRAMGSREQLRIGLLTAPGLLVIGFTLILPMLWLVWLSVVGADGEISGENYRRMLEPVYLTTFFTTFKVSAIVTVVVVLLGYPLAYLLSQLPKRAASICMIFVILPFWTSVLVRTYAWLVILQRRGVINTWLLDSGLIHEPLSLVNNLTGTVIGMTHVMLPCLVFPLYSAMKTIDPGYLRAASNCGASPIQAFWQVFFPLSVPGLSAGIVLVFTLSLGYYITPALLGGGKVVMWAMQIESSISMYSNWGAASALGVVLVAVTLGILFVLNRLFRINPYGRK